MFRNFYTLVYGYSAVWAVPCIIVLGFWTQRNLEFWFEFLKGFHTPVPYWLSLVTTFFLGTTSIMFNLFGELARVYVSKAV